MVEEAGIPGENHLTFDRKTDNNKLYQLHRVLSKRHSSTVDSFIFRGYQFSWIAENLHFYGYLISWFCKGLYTKPIENMLFVEHLNSWFPCIKETHENWYPTNINESTVTYDHCSIQYKICKITYQNNK